MKNYKEFLNESKSSGILVQSIDNELQENLSNSFISSDANKIAAYSDMDANDRKALDDYCMDEYGLPFMGVGFEEQSTARSVIWAKKEDPESIEKQNIIDSNL